MPVTIIEAIKAYHDIVHGPTVPERIRNVSTLFILFFAPLFFIHKLKACENDICNLKDYFDMERSLFREIGTINHPAAFVLDNGLIFIVSVAFAVIVSILLRQEILNDALSPLRSTLLGKWSLELKRFADNGNINLVISVDINLTQDQKLSISPTKTNMSNVDLSNIFQSISLNVINSASFNLSFIIRENISDDKEFYYYCSLIGEALENLEKPRFSGDWFQLNDLGNPYPGKGSIGLVK